MSLSSTVIVQDPVDARELFAACLAAVDLPPDAKWHLMEFDDCHMLQAKPDQGGSALVSVHFAPDGGLYPADSEATDQPEGYAYVAFETPGFVAASDHERIGRTIGQWLADRHLHWAWRYEEHPWMEEMAQVTPVDV